MRSEASNELPASSLQKKKDPSPLLRRTPPPGTLRNGKNNTTTTTTTVQPRQHKLIWLASGIDSFCWGAGCRAGRFVCLRLCEGGESVQLQMTCDEEKFTPWDVSWQDVLDLWVTLIFSSNFPPPCLAFGFWYFLCTVTQSVLHKAGEEMTLLLVGSCTREIGWHPAL